MFSRRKTTAEERDDLRRMGRLEAEVESLRLQWTNYRDEIKKLVNRLEKREQRAEKKALDEVAETVETAPSVSVPEMDPITEKLFRRRNHVVS